MIKQIFATVLLSGSLSTASLDIRDNNNRRYNISLLNSNQWTSNNYSYSGSTTWWSNLTTQNQTDTAITTETTKKSGYTLNGSSLDYTAYEITCIKIDATAEFLTTLLKINNYVDIQNQPINDYVTTKPSQTTTIYVSQDQTLYTNYTNIDATTPLNCYGQLQLYYSRFRRGYWNYNYEEIYTETQNNTDGWTINQNLELNLDYNEINYIYILTEIQKNSGTLLKTDNYMGLTKTVTSTLLTGIQTFNTPVTEYIDIPSIMFYVATMPFTFISQAFNLTLFPGTPYQINISNLFLCFIGVLIFAWILRLIVTKGQ